MRSREELLFEMQRHMDMMQSLEARLKEVLESAQLCWVSAAEFLTQTIGECAGDSSARVTTGPNLEWWMTFREAALKWPGVSVNEVGVYGRFLNHLEASRCWADSEALRTGGSASQPPRSDEPPGSLRGALCALGCVPGLSAHIPTTAHSALNDALRMVEGRLCSVLHQWDSEQTVTARQTLTKLTDDIRTSLDRLHK